MCESLHEHGIEHEREPLYPADQVFNSSRRWRQRANWILRDGTLVELWEMPVRLGPSSQSWCRHLRGRPTRRGATQT